MSPLLNRLRVLLAVCSARSTASWVRFSTRWKLLRLKRLQKVELRREHRHQRRQHRNRERQLKLLRSPELTEHRRQQLASLQETTEGSPLHPFSLSHLLSPPTTSRSSSTSGR